MTSRTAALEEALLATGFPPDLRGQERTLDWWRYFSLHAQSLRRTGSTALNMAYVAAGRFDGYWAFDNHVWDVAGGTVLVQEAGGMLSNTDGSTYDPYTADALATNGILHPALLEALEADGFKMDGIRVQRSCHTKGIIVDGETVLLGSPAAWASSPTLVASSRSTTSTSS